MSAKSFEVTDPVNSSLKGFALANPSITLVPEEKILFRKTDSDKIALISGGGSDMNLHTPVSLVRVC